MGSIINIWANPKNWHVIDDSSFHVKQTGEDLVKVSVGVGDFDYYTCDIEIYVRKNIYDKLMTGEYKVRKNQVKLVIEDKDGNVIPPYFEDGQFLY